MRQNLLFALGAAVVLAVIMACSGEGIPATDPTPIPTPAAAVPDPGVRPTLAVTR
jgi:hypothetical protein